METHKKYNFPKGPTKTKIILEIGAMVPETSAIYHTIKQTLQLCIIRIDIKISSRNANI